MRRNIAIFFMAVSAFFIGLGGNSARAYEENYVDVPVRTVWTNVKKENRPEIRTRIMEDNGQTEHTLILSSDNDWTGVIKNVYKDPYSRYSLGLGSSDGNFEFKAYGDVRANLGFKVYVRGYDTTSIRVRLDDLSGNLTEEASFDLYANDMFVRTISLKPGEEKNFHDFDSYDENGDFINYSLRSRGDDGANYRIVSNFDEHNLGVDFDLVREEENPPIDKRPVGEPEEDNGISINPIQPGDKEDEGHYEETTNLSIFIKDQGEKSASPTLVTIRNGEEVILQRYLNSGVEFNKYDLKSYDEDGKLIEYSLDIEEDGHSFEVIRDYDEYNLRLVYKIDRYVGAKPQAPVNPLPVNPNDKDKDSGISENPIQPGDREEDKKDYEDETTNLSIFIKDQGKKSTSPILVRIKNGDDIVLERYLNSGVEFNEYDLKSYDEDGKLIEYTLEIEKDGHRYEIDKNYDEYNLRLVYKIDRYVGEEPLPVNPSEPEEGENPVDEPSKEDGKKEPEDSETPGVVEPEEDEDSGISENPIQPEEGENPVDEPSKEDDKKEPEDLEVPGVVEPEDKEDGDGGLSENPIQPDDKEDPVDEPSKEEPEVPEIPGTLDPEDKKDPVDEPSKEDDKKDPEVPEMPEIVEPEEDEDSGISENPIQPNESDREEEAKQPEQPEVPSLPVYPINPGEGSSSNKKDKISISLVNIWKLNDSRMNKKPYKDLVIRYNLYANGRLVDSLDLSIFDKIKPGNSYYKLLDDGKIKNKENIWFGEFTNLAKYDEDGKLIKYDLIQVSRLNGFNFGVKEDGGNFIFTNSQIPKAHIKKVGSLESQIINVFESLEDSSLEESRLKDVETVSYVLEEEVSTDISREHSSLAYPSQRIETKEIKKPALGKISLAKKDLSGQEKASYELEGVREGGLVRSLLLLLALVLIYLAKKYSDKKENI